jgi:type II secretory pathway pseudopilin PulG
MRRARSRSGFSLVELALVVGLLGLVLGIPLLLLRSSRRLQETATTRASLDGLARRTLDALSRRLELSGVTTIPQAGGGPALGTSNVEFQPAVDWIDDTVVWGATERLALASEPTDPNDGVDNDGDGLIDEKRVLWTTDLGLLSEQTRVVCKNVADMLTGELGGNGFDDNGNGLIDEQGLVFSFDGDRVTVRLALAARDAGGSTIQHTAERVIAFRN